MTTPDWRAAFFALVTGTRGPIPSGICPEPGWKQGRACAGCERCWEEWAREGQDEKEE